MGDLFESGSARPMLIGRIARPYDDAESLFELKLDGERCLAYLDGTGVSLINRRGTKVLWRLPELEGIHRQVNARCILDGEVITGLGGKADFDAIKTRMSHQSKLKIELGAKQSPASLVVFDILYHGDAAVTGRPLEERKALLEKTVTDSPQMARARSIETRGKAFYELVLQQGLEGVVGKRRDSLYYPGKRTRDWVKVKNLEEDDYVICGYIPAEHVAMLVLGQYDEADRMVYKGRVTLGLRTGDFAEIQRVPRAAGWPFAQPPPREAEENVFWLAPKLVCTVCFIHKQAGGLMRQPHYRRLRPDKAPGEARETQG